MAIGKIFRKAAKAADRAKRENQKKPINELMSKDKGQQKESGMGTASKQRIRGAERSKEFAGIKKQYERDLKKLNTDKNLTDEQMERLVDKLRDMRQKLTEAGIKVPAMNRGGAVKKAMMMRGGMANKKEHMYAAGGSVMDNLTSAQRNMVKKMAAANKK
tara:strand:- start:98 stop:577 length:480 start_codon:yes stop_codon:yes gene_type:complete